MTPFPLLPPAGDIETRAVLKLAARAGRALAELKGVSATMPNQTVLINTLSLQEAQDSSAIENIITTQDDLYKEELFPDLGLNVAAKEVRDYVVALKLGFESVKTTGLLTMNQILEIQEAIERNRAGVRRLPGTALVNDLTGQVVYTPPTPDALSDLLRNLEAFIHDDRYEADPLVKMALIHHQFESIHPFYDGNGRTGRILNVLYLVQKGLLDIPVLYLSRALIRTKGEYYRQLQAVRDTGDWEPWLLYMLGAVEKTSMFTIHMVRSIGALMSDAKQRIREEYRFYSQDLLNNLFSHPYTKIDLVVRDLNVTRKTASKYLDDLSEGGFLEKHKIGTSNYYINRPLFDLFSRQSEVEWVKIANSYPEV